MTVVSSYAGDEQMIAAATSIKAMGTPFVRCLKRGLTPILGGPCHRRWTAPVSTRDSRDSGQPYSFAAMRYAFFAGVIVCAAFACAPRTAADMSAAEKTAIADTLKRLVVSAYDLSKPDPVKNLMSFTPGRGG